MTLWVLAFISWSTRGRGLSMDATVHHRAAVLELKKKREQELVYKQGKKYVSSALILLKKPSLALRLFFSRPPRRSAQIAQSKNPMPSSSATRRFVVFLAYLFSALERSDAGFLKALP